MIIDQRLVPLALDHVDAWNFERFGQAFYGALQDREFVPLGGVHDGGAEGFDDPANDAELFADSGATNFLQVSKQVATRKKVRDTVKRLREFGRHPKVLTYLTSQTVTNIDGEQVALSKELECAIRIRDAKFIEANINSSPAIQELIQVFSNQALLTCSNPAPRMSPNEQLLTQTGRWQFFCGKRSSIVVGGQDYWKPSLTASFSGP